MARYDDLNTGAIAYTAFISTVILLVLILLGRALTYALINGEMERKTAGATYGSADEQISEQLESLDGYVKKTVPKPPAEGESESTETMEILTIPVDRAKSLIFEELGTDEGKAEA